MNRKKQSNEEIMFRCPECGGNVKLLATEGRRMTYRNLPDLEVPADLAIPTCDRCGEQYVSDSVAKAIASGMRPLYE